MPGRSVIETTASCIDSTDDLQVLFNPVAETSCEGRFRPLGESSLCGSIVDYLSGQFSDGLYTHQHDAIESVLAGDNTVVATRTSSGKSLIYSLPAFHTVCEDPNATALFLYPQKALANDQLLKLREMATAFRASQIFMPARNTLSAVMMGRPTVPSVRQFVNRFS